VVEYLSKREVLSSNHQRAPHLSQSAVHVLKCHTAAISRYDFYVPNKNIYQKIILQKFLYMVMRIKLANKSQLTKKIAHDCVPWLPFPNRGVQSRGFFWLKASEIIGAFSVKYLSRPGTFEIPFCLKHILPIPSRHTIFIHG
jgi:hypothetical protein